MSDRKTLVPMNQAQIRKWATIRTLSEFARALETRARELREALDDAAHGRIDEAGMKTLNEMANFIEREKKWVIKVP